MDRRRGHLSRMLDARTRGGPCGFWESLRSSAGSPRRRGGPYRRSAWKVGRNPGEFWYAELAPVPIATMYPRECCLGELPRVDPARSEGWAGAPADPRTFGAGGDRRPCPARTLGDAAMRRPGASRRFPAESDRRPSANRRVGGFARNRPQAKRPFVPMADTRPGAKRSFSDGATRRPGAKQTAGDAARWRPRTTRRSAGLPRTAPRAERSVLRFADALGSCRDRVCGFGENLRLPNARRLWVAGNLRGARDHLLAEVNCLRIGQEIPFAREPSACK